MKKEKDSSTINNFNSTDLKQSITSLISRNTVQDLLNPYEIVTIFTLLSGIISYLILSFSDPGYILIETKTIEDFNMEKKKSSSSSFVAYEIELKNQDNPTYNNNPSEAKVHINHLNLNELIEFPITCKISSERQLSSMKKTLSFNESEKDKYLSNSDRKGNVKVVSTTKNSQSKRMLFSPNDKQKAVFSNLQQPIIEENVSSNMTSKKLNEHNQDIEFTSVLNQKKGFLHKQQLYSKFNAVQNGSYSQRSDLAVNRNININSARRIDSVQAFQERSRTDQFYEERLNKKESLIKDKKLSSKENYKINNKTRLGNEGNISSSAQENTATHLNQKPISFNKLLNKNKINIDMVNLELKDTKADIHLDMKIDSKNYISKDNYNQGFNSKNERTENINFIQINQNFKQNTNEIKKVQHDLNCLDSVFCSVCFLDIPLRAKHCRICKHCVATFDHHCSWIGNCVGEKNKYLYMIFLSIHIIEFLLSIYKSLVSFKYFSHTSDWIQINIILLINLLAECLFFTFVMGLFVYHVKLVFSNQSTWENLCWYKIDYMRKLTNSQESPFDFGWKNNLSYLFCYKYNNEEKYIDWKKVKEK